MTGACQSLWKIMHAQHLESCLLVKGSCKIKIVQPLINIWLDKLFNLVGNYLWGWTLGSEVYSWQYVPLLTVCPFADSMSLCWQYAPLLAVCTDSITIHWWSTTKDLGNAFWMLFWNQKDTKMCYNKSYWLENMNGWSEWI